VLSDAAGAGSDTRSLQALTAAIGACAGIKLGGEAALSREPALGDAAASDGAAGRSATRGF